MDNISLTTNRFDNFFLETIMIIMFLYTRYEDIDIVIVRKISVSLKDNLNG